MKSRLLYAFLLSLAALVSGCATNKMAFESEEERVTPASKPIYLMTATLKNAYRTSFQPKASLVFIEKPGSKENANFLMDAKAKNETGTPEAGNTYLLRLPLDQGKYEIRGINAQAMSFPIIASYFVPIHLPLEVKSSGVFYLGHLSATLRERQGKEFKAGGTLPLIDQAVGGASGGTFDIEISDRFATDEAMFRAKFPALKGVDIQKAILPPFDRAVAQKWWEDH